MQRTADEWRIHLEQNDFAEVLGLEIKDLPHGMRTYHKEGRIVGFAGRGRPDPQYDLRRVYIEVDNKVLRMQYNSDLGCLSEAEWVPHDEISNHRCISNKAVIMADVLGIDIPEEILGQFDVPEAEGLKI